VIVKPISSPLAGEHVIVVEPELAYPNVDAGWLRRLRLFTGRALDAVALTAEQDGRAGKLALLGQTRSPGVVTGLEVALEGTGAAARLHVAPGIGLMASGEDVVLGHALRVAPAALGAPAADLRAAILVLVPVTTRVANRFASEDPCERDDSEDAFADEIRVDGAQLELVPWDTAWGALDAASARRNQLAYRIFELERALAFGEIAPWQVRGVPIALLGLDAGAITYVDRHAVARVGGAPPVRAPLVVEAARAAGTPALCQARILQLVDHLADLRTPAGALPSTSAAQLDSLPPAGVIPRDAIDFTAPFTNKFFPPTWRLRAVPLPTEQLDGVLAHAAALAPLATAISEEVVVIAPVPQAVFEPHLLEQETLSGEFQAEIDKLIVERTDWLGRRQYLRTRRDTLLHAADPASVVAYPDPDPDRLEDEGAIGEVSAAEEAFDVDVADGQLRSHAVSELVGRLEHNAAISADDRTAIVTKGLVQFIADLTSRVQQSDDAIDFGFLRAQSDIYRLRQLVLGNVLGTKLATSPALASIAQGETATAVRADLVTLLGNLRTTPTRTEAPAAPVTTTPSVPPGSGTLFVRRVEPPPSASAERVAAAAGALHIAAAAPSLFISSAGLAAAAPEADALRPALAVALARDLGGDTIVHEVEAGGPVTPQPADITEAAPVVGAAEFRNITAAQRIFPPPAPEARQYAVATRHEGLQALQKLHGLGMNVDDITVYSTPGDGRPSKTFGDIRTGAGGIDSVLNDPAPTGAVEESVFFHDTVTLMEAHIGTLRGLEGRVAQARAALRDCQTTLDAVRASTAKVDARMTVVQHELTDVRHAIATARALMAEEVARIARINTRRTAVIATYVEYLAYVRPRFFEGTLAVPELALDPALLESPVPACIAGHDEAPPELAELVALLREAPLAWLRLAPPILRFLDRVELLHGAMLTARTRAAAVTATGFQTRFLGNQIAGRFARSITAVGQAQVDAVMAPRAQVAELDLRKLIGLSWLESRDVARDVISLGDLIEGGHRRNDAIAESHALIANIEKVAGCLWAQVGQVAPAVRLAWAEALDQYASAHVTIELPTLPRWREVPPLDRKKIELLANWLIDQIDRTIPAAVAWMHDLVRACILLASHAPIDEIIAGEVPTPSPAGPGHLVPVIIDPVRVKVGMRVQFFQGHDVVAHGIVEDLLGERARARIAEAVTPELRLDAKTRARFAVAGSPARPLTRELL
jgi:hypothetical protein